MNRKQLALIMFLISGVMGLFGAGIFYGYTLGINVPIFMIIATGVILLSARLSSRHINRRNLWVIIPMLFFAFMIAIRASSLLILLNMLSMLVLGTLFARYLKSEQAIDTDSILNHIFTPLDAGFYAMYAPLVEVAYSFSFVREHSWKDIGNLGAVLRGLLFAIPIVLVFTILLASADSVFAESFNGIFDWLLSGDMFQYADSFLLAGFIGWLMLSALSYALVNPIPHHDVTPQAQDDGVKKQIPGFRIGMIEATMVLGSVTLLFLFFVLIQFTYLFGGQAMIAESLNYSQYARRGFFELVTVAVLVLGMILYFDHITLRRDQRQGIIFRLLAFVIVGLTMVMLVSAWRRMELYELAYGFTYLRVLTHVFMFWLALLLVFAVLHILKVRTNIFALGLLLSCIGYVATLNIMNLDNYIAERNIQAYLANESEVELDICYLRGLSVDAAPAMIDFYYQSMDRNENQFYDHIGWWIRQNQNNESPTMHLAPLMMDLLLGRPSLSEPPELDPDIQYACYGRYLF